MNDRDDMELDLEYFREKLALLEEPELPSSLSAAALFQRMDEGTLTLPEEEAVEEAIPAGEPAREETAAPAVGEKVIPWKNLLKRGIPLAACLALVLVLYQGHEVGLAKNFTGDTAPAASCAPATQEAPAEAAYDTYSADETGESASDNGAGAPSILRSSQSEDAEAIPEEGETANSITSNSQVGAPVPEPSPAEGEATKGEADNGTEKTEGSNDMNAGVIGGEEMAPMHPDVGGGEPEEAPMYPDAGGPDAGINPDIGMGSEEDNRYSEALRKRDKAIEAQAMEIAAQHAPEEGLIPKWSSWGEDGDQVEFTIIYWDPEEHPIAQYHFDFRAESTEGSDVPQLVLVSFHREELSSYWKK